MANNDDKSIVLEIFNENIRSLNNTYNLVDYKQISKVVKLIDKSKVIRLYGLGASFLVANDFQQKLERISKMTVLYEDTQLQLISSTNIQEDELAIVIFYSEQTKEVLEMARNIKLNNATLVSITKYSNNKLFNLSDFSLNVPNIEKNLRAAASSSRISQLIIIDILYNSYLEMYRDQFMKRIIKTNEILGKEE
ncbi:MurR/RpiR family transcriptional regulator [Helcococcus ovis]|uniref:MurR/RpiR family transcriptional regulator n=1 Tax=Helcococcus ovis TaxID=72026 RepID=A0A4R9C4P4_9FIRM|nr:MurR/RpiR family transcriptional regulator [Helcococcus ovis]TFF67627.1 MurR/RpiR family transcriptional regulator [Helcococcus ovis]